jgi:rod shape-determining protein MreC
LNKRALLLISGIIILFCLVGYYLDKKYLIRENVTEMINLEKENEKLKARVDGIEELKVEAKLLEKENEEYRKLIDVKKKLEKNKKILIGTVIERDITQGKETWYEDMTINKGAKDGIKEDLPVVSSPFGLIGIIKEVKDETSKVELLTTQKNQRLLQVPAMVENEEKQNVYGILSSYDTTENTLLLTKVPNDISLKKGEMVVTSDKSIIYPADIPIGKITSVVPGDYGLTQQAVIKPFSDFENINDVFVIIGDK